MITARSLFLSDLHLGTPDCHAEELLHWLAGIQAERIYLIGDVLDLTRLRHRACWPAAHGRVLEELCGRARAGVRVVYLPGNHDAAMHELAGLLGGAIEVHRQLLHTTAAGLRLLLLHGDQFESRLQCSRLLAGIGSLAYDFTLSLTRRCNQLRKLMGWPEWALVSAVKNRLPVVRRYVAAFEAAALAAARSAGADGVVCGHIHDARLRVRDGVVYANTGDWVESCTAIFEELDGELKLWRRTAAAQALSYDQAAAPVVTGA